MAHAEKAARMIYGYDAEQSDVDNIAATIRQSQDIFDIGLMDKASQRAHDIFVYGEGGQYGVPYLERVDDLQPVVDEMARFYGIKEAAPEPVAVMVEAPSPQEVVVQEEKPTREVKKVEKFLEEKIKETKEKVAEKIVNNPELKDSFSETLAAIAERTGPAATRARNLKTAAVVIPTGAAAAYGINQLMSPDEMSDEEKALLILQQRGLA